MASWQAFQMLHTGGGGPCFSFRKKRNDAIEIGTAFFFWGGAGKRGGSFSKIRIEGFIQTNHEISRFVIQPGSWKKDALMKWGIIWIMIFPKCRAKNNKKYKKHLSTYQLDFIEITIFNYLLWQTGGLGPLNGVPAKNPNPFHKRKSQQSCQWAKKIYYWLTICESEKLQWFKQLWCFFWGHIGWLSTTIMESMPYAKIQEVALNLFFRTVKPSTWRNARGTPYHHPTIPPICAISGSVVIFKLDGLSLQFGAAFFSTPKNSRLLGDSWVFPYEQTHNTNLTAKLWRWSLLGWLNEFFNGKIHEHLFLGWRLAKQTFFRQKKGEVHHTALFT